MSRPIYYLVSSVGDECEEEYIMAMSFDKKVLENMIYTSKSSKLIIRENLKIFNLWIGYDSEKLCDKYHIMYVNSQRDYTKSKLYAFNRLKRINNGLYYIYENY